MKIRRKDDPEKWPLPGLMMPNHTHTDFSQLINCPEFVPRQLSEDLKGENQCLQDPPASLCFCLNQNTEAHIHTRSSLCFCVSTAGSSRSSTPVQPHTKTEPDISNLKTMPKGLSASLPDLDSESWIEVKKRPRPSPARPKVRSANDQRHSLVCCNQLSVEEEYLIIYLVYLQYFPAVRQAI